MQLLTCTMLLCFFLGACNIVAPSSLALPTPSSETGISQRDKDHSACINRCRRKLAKQSATAACWPARCRSDRRPRRRCPTRRPARRPQ